MSCKKYNWYFANGQVYHKTNIFLAKQKIISKYIAVKNIYY